MISFNGRPLICVAVASIALAVGTYPAAAGSPEVPPAYVLIPAQLSTARTQPPPVKKKRMSAPAKPDGGLTAQEYKRLVEAMKRLTPQDRKRLAKAMKRLTPEERRRLAEVVMRQLARKGAASQANKYSK
jgi:hypothetical protein